MDKLYIIGLDQSGHYLGKDVDKLNDFLTNSDNDAFEIKKMKIMPNGEVFITVSDYNWFFKK